MKVTEKEVAIAHKLYECRSTLRSLSQAGYAAQIAPWMRKLREYPDPMKAAMHAMQSMQDANEDGFVQMTLLAALVEVLEPDEETPEVQP